MNMLRDEVEQLLDEVFNEDWEPKNCGRDKCKQLIYAMSKMFPGESFGDSTTGFMCVCKIKEFATIHKLH